MARRVQDIETEPLDVDALAFRHPHGDDVGVRSLAHHRDAVGAVAQRRRARDVIGVQMRVERLDQLEIKLAHQLEIALDPLQNRIDDQRLAAMPAGDEISVSARHAVEELSKDHGRHQRLDGHSNCCSRRRPRASTGNGQGLKPQRGCGTMRR